MYELFKDLPDALKNNENFHLRISYRPKNSVPILPNIQETDSKNVDEILKHLYSKSIQTLLVEGGGITISHFLKADCFDELHVYYAPKLLGKGLSFFHGKNSLEQNMGLTLKKVEKFDNDIKLTYYKK